MKKHVLILPLLLLTACARMTGYEDDSEEFYDADTGAVSEASGLDWRAESTPVQQPAVRQNQVRPQRPMGQPPIQQPRISPDGTMIELPAQQIFLGDAGGQQATAPALPLPPISFSEPRGGQSIPMPPPIPPKPTMVTLQNVSYPNTFAQCTADDLMCIASYEQQGYRRLNGSPQFAGYHDQLKSSDYPPNGRWRNGNNIPRW